MREAVRQSSLHNVWRTSFRGNPVKISAETRVTGMDDSVTPDEVMAAVAEAVVSSLPSSPSATPLEAQILLAAVNGQRSHVEEWRCVYEDFPP
jgi:hypothetical protein